jgi:hypothetical protein
MKYVWTSLKWIGGAALTVVGGYIYIETWVQDTASDVIRPVQVEVSQLSKRQDDMIKAVDSRMNSIDAKLNILIQRR